MEGGSTVHELGATELGETHPETSHPMASTGAPTRGQTIGRFVVLDELGTGGMGVVYAAYDPHLDRKVALKVLRAQAMESDEARARLLREAQAMARIDHPNVLRIHEAGTFEDRIYIAMEFAPQGTLRQWLAQRKRGPREIASAFIAAGRGLVAAHAAGLVHRDFKPDNVLMFENGGVRVTDFGLVGVIGELPTSRPPDLDAPLSETTPLSQDLTRTGAMMGTPSYMAPEQFRGQAVGAEADQFAFCVALYEALYHQRPFAGATFAELCANVISGDIAPVPRDSAVPARIERVVRRGLATDPAKRYASMDDLLRALARVPRPRLWLAGGGAAVVAATGIALFALRSPASTPCTGADTRLATAWNPTLRATLAQTLDASHRPDARAVFTRVASLVDRWGSAWQQAYIGACEDTRVREIQSDHVLDLRMACLTRQLDDSRIALDTLASSGGDAVAHAFDVARALPDVSPCADTVALTAPIAPPATPQARQAVGVIRAELARARAESKLAHYTHALELARHSLDDARKLGYRPVIAEALLRVGMVQKSAADRGAADTLRDALTEATAVGDSETAIRAAAGQIDQIEDQRSLQPLADELGRIATAMSERTSVSASAMANLGGALGQLLKTEGHVDEAKARFEQTITYATKQLGPDNEQTVSLISKLAILEAERHHFDEARKMFEQVAAAEKRIYGPDHPQYATALDNLANIDAERGQSADSRGLREKALAIRIAALGPDHVDVARSYLNLGAVYDEAGDLQTAKSYFEKSLAGFRKAYGDDSVQTTTVLVDLGSVLSSLGDRAGARTLTEQAVAIAEKGYPADDPRLAEVIHNLALIARREGHPADALALFQRAEQIMIKKNGPNDARAADYGGEIATTYADMHKLPEASEQTKRTLAAMAVVYGADSSRMAVALGNYGSLQIQLHDYAGALASFQQSGAIFEAKLGKSHPMVGNTLLGAAFALGHLQRHAEAIADLERALSIGKLEPDRLGQVHYALARELYANPTTRVRAHAEAKLALDAYQQADDKREIKSVHAWQRTH